MYGRKVHAVEVLLKSGNLEVFYSDYTSWTIDRVYSWSPLSDKIEKCIRTGTVEFLHFKVQVVFFREDERDLQPWEVDNDDEPEEKESTMTIRTDCIQWVRTIYNDEE